jgi:hypothetical protein
VKHDHRKLQVFPTSWLPACLLAAVIPPLILLPAWALRFKLARIVSKVSPANSSSSRDRQLVTFRADENYVSKLRIGDG